MKFEEKKYKIADIVRHWSKGTIRRNEEYQRGEAWTEVQKQTLVDSILRDYPIPSLFFEAKTDTDLDGNVSKVSDVVDGQQRIIALADYFAGKFDLLRSDNPKLRIPNRMRAVPVPWGGLRFDHLQPDDKSTLENRELTVFVIEGAEHQDHIRDRFIRLQSGTALTRQQVRDAWPGGLGPFVQELAGKLGSRPTYTLFDFIDKRSTRDEEGDAKDPYVKQRVTCAQVLRILLGRMSDPYRIHGLGAADLDALYHEFTDFDRLSVTAQEVKGILNDCEAVRKELDAKAWGKRKFPKVSFFALAMFFQDVRRNPLVKLNRPNYKRLASYATDGAPDPTGKSTSGKAVREYYEKWRDTLPRDAFIELDPTRTFDAFQKAEMFARDGAQCAICLEPLEVEGAEGDHYPVPHRDGGRTDVSNGRLVHPGCHPRGRPRADE